MRPVPDALMLFAAGLGTRMGALTADRPKPLIEIGGECLIDHALNLVDEAGIERVVINLHYLPDQIRAHLNGRANVIFSDESDALLETGGGLRAALPHLGAGPVFTLNTDAVWTGANALRQLRDAWRPAEMEGLLLLVPREQAIGHSGAGDFSMDSYGRLSRGREYVYTGAQILTTGRLASVQDKAFSLNRIWDEMQAPGRLYGLLHDGGWCDVGRPEAIPLAEGLQRRARDVRA
ncbi:MAG: nucleotidyltransferase family protein [Paracoccaceae bacterium]